jgi:hypothetical protein
LYSIPANSLNYLPAGSYAVAVGIGTQSTGTYWPSETGGGITIASQVAGATDFGSGLWIVGFDFLVPITLQ